MNYEKRQIDSEKVEYYRRLEKKKKNTNYKRRQREHIVKCKL